MGRYYYSPSSYRGENRFIGPLLPFVGGLLIGGLVGPRPNFYQPVPYYPPYYPPTGYAPYVGTYPNNYNVTNTEIPTYYTSVNADTANVYPYPTNLHY